MTTLILWRHGITEWNAERRVQGQTDTPLSGIGRTQAAVAAQMLAARKPDALVSSDLARCTGTAAPLAELTGLVVQLDRRLRERHYGEWQGLTMGEVADRFPEAYARQRGGSHDLGHGIEPPTDVAKRVGEALREITDATPGGTTVVVTHGGAARYGVFDLLDWPQSRLGGMAVLSNCHYTELSFDPVRGWMLRAHNVGAMEGAPGYE